MEVGTLRSIVLALIVVLAGCGSSGATAGQESVQASPSPSPSPSSTVGAAPSDSAGAAVSASPPPATERVELAGDGHRNTEPFHLAGGDYRIDSTVTPSDSGGCVFGSFLRSTDRTYAEIAGDGDLEGAKAETSTTYLYGVPEGRYYVEVIALCHWTIVMTRA